jgi:hypothetical protein
MSFATAGNRGWQSELKRVALPALESCRCALRCQFMDGGDPDHGRERASVSAGVISNTGGVHPEVAAIYDRRSNRILRLRL